MIQRPVSWCMEVAYRVPMLRMITVVEVSVLESVSETPGRLPKTRFRILREVDGGKAIPEVCRERNFSEVIFDCWRQQLGQLEIHDPRRLKELAREDNELKNMKLESSLILFGAPEVVVPTEAVALPVAIVPAEISVVRRDQPVKIAVATLYRPGNRTSSVLGIAVKGVQDSLPSVR